MQNSNNNIYDLSICLRFLRENFSSNATAVRMALVKSYINTNVKTCNAVYVNGKETIPMPTCICRIYTKSSANKARGGDEAVKVATSPLRALNLTTRSMSDPSLSLSPESNFRCLHATEFSLHSFLSSALDLLIFFFYFSFFILSINIYLFSSSFLVFLFISFYSIRFLSYNFFLFFL